MIVVHAGWSLPLDAIGQGKLIVWAETSDVKLKKPHGRARFPRHPYCLPPEQLTERLRPVAQLPEWAASEFLYHQPALDRLPLPSPRLVHAWSEFEGASQTGLGYFKLAGLSLSPEAALEWLIRVPSREDLLSNLAIGDDLLFWSTAAGLCLEMLTMQRYVPAIVQQDGRAFQARWRPVFDRGEDADRLSALIRGMPPSGRAYLPADLQEAANAPPARLLLENFFGSCVDAYVRGRSGAHWHPLTGEDVSTRWLNALFARDAEIRGPYFSLSTLYQAYKSWMHQLEISGDANFRVCLRLGVPREAGKLWPLEYLLQGRQDPSLLVPSELIWGAKGEALTYLEHRFENPQERFLTALGYIAKIFPPVEASLHERSPAGVNLNTGEAYQFLREAAPILEQSGFGLLVPPWWNKRGAHLAARLRIKSQQDPPVSSGLLGKEQLVKFDWEVVLAGQALSREEFEALVRLKSPLVEIRGEWVALNPEEVESAIRFWAKRRSEREMSWLDALSWGIEGEGQIDDLNVEEVQFDGWLGSLLDQLERGEQLQPLDQPEGLTGQLRPYQCRGFSWIHFMRSWGLGACLADDMGLGKTIQTIAALLHARRRNGQAKGITPDLVICPTSVIGNWQREIEQFAPSLRVFLHHGGERASGEEFMEEAARHDVVVTSYGMSRRDVDLLAGMHWGVLVLDEAQNIKNPSAKQTQAVRRIPAAFRLALTGTPVENRLSELWSIMQFLNPGYLGSQKSFRKNFSIPIERYHDQEATRQLRKRVGPFILRRVKTDPVIIQDLPEKMEMKVFCNLTQEQASLYQAVMEESLREIETADKLGNTIARRGMVLSTLLKLKQVCNHPAQFLGDRSELAERSGKLNRLTEMMEEVLSVGDRALLFSQFSSMGELLKVYLQETFGREVLFLHGGTPRKTRQQMIERFQSERSNIPVFVLSLKAGGLGLNLTAANHVFHFDRWWNPAVEQQATDRAYRIGQKQDVQVHKFLCVGTLEENIDELIESKRALAEQVISADEGWLTELSTDELRDILSLKPEAVA